MKKLFLLGAMVCALGMMTDCKSANYAVVENDITCSTDTIYPTNTVFAEQAIEVIQNGIVWEDVRISQAEFEEASLRSDQYQMIRSERTPDAKDSTIVREWARAIGLDFEDCMEERGFVYFSPYDCTTDKLGKPYVYKTPPRWWPVGDSFWGADGWFFIQGWDKERNTEYHKVRPKMKK